MKEYPPSGWNGTLIFIGVSEGGPLVTDLSIICPDTLATINWVGAGDWCWADELWQFFANWKQNSFWIRLYDAIPRCLPFSSDIPRTRQEFDVLVEDIINNPTPNQSMGGMIYLYHADAFPKPAVDYRKIRSPFLVVKGTADSDMESSDQFVHKAMKAGASGALFYGSLYVDSLWVDETLRNKGWGKSSCMRQKAWERSAELYLLLSTQWTAKLFLSIRSSGIQLNSQGKGTKKNRRCLC